MRVRATRLLSISQGGLGNQLWDLAGNRPSLDLPFAESKSLVDATTGTNLIDFTRASSGTYVGSDGLIKTATTNEPRFDHNPTTGESLGLLVEEQRTNLLPYSEALALWQIPTTESSNTTVSPGGNTAYGLDSASSASMSVSNPAAITFSVFAKPGTSDFIYLRTVNWGTLHRVWFNLSAGTVGSISPPSENIKNVGISELSNGWYRVFFTLDSTGDSVGNLQITSTDADLNTNTVGYVFAWGAQVEEGSFPTSYIPTTDSAVTRAADVASISGSNFSSWYRQDEGTVFMETQLYSTFARNAAGFDINDNSANNRAIFRAFTTGSADQFTVRSGGSTVAQISSIGSPSVAIRKSAATISLNNYAISADGASPVEDTSGALPISASQLFVGSALFGAESMGGYIRRLTYWQTRLPDSTLQGITQ